MKTLKEIAQRIALRKDKLNRSLNSVVEQLKKLGAIKIIIFGSLVSYKLTPSSDLDILAIMPSTRTGKQWLNQIYKETKRVVACDIFVFNSEEYEKNKDRNFLLKEIEKKGKVLYEKRLS